MDHGKILVNDTPFELKKLIPGGTVLEVRAHAPGNADAIRENVRIALNAIQGVAKVEVAADQDETADPALEPGRLSFRLYGPAANSMIGPSAQAVLSSGAQVRDLSVKQPSLEEVFIFLTGRHLR